MPKKKLKSGGQTFRLSILQVTGRDDDGRHRMFRLINPEESVSTENEPAFITGYLSEEGLKLQRQEHN